MANTTRRKLITTTTAGAVLAVTGVAATESSGDMISSCLVHHVFFWLKRPDSVSDREQLIQGIRSLADIETVRGIHVGVPADTMARGVIDSSWSVSEILYFEDAAGQDAYQVHPLHKAFVDAHEHLWEKVVVYDVKAAD